MMPAGTIIVRSRIGCWICEWQESPLAEQSGDAAKRKTVVHIVVIIGINFILVDIQIVGVSFFLDGIRPPVSVAT